jgi:hypothetical protein
MTRRPKRPGKDNILDVIFGHQKPVSIFAFQIGFSCSGFSRIEDF